MLCMHVKIHPLFITFRRKSLILFSLTVFIIFFAALFAVYDTLYSKLGGLGGESKPAVDFSPQRPQVLYYGVLCYVTHSFWISCCRIVLHAITFTNCDNSWVYLTVDFISEIWSGVQTGKIRGVFWEQSTPSSSQTWNRCIRKNTFGTWLVAIPFSSPCRRPIVDKCT